LALLGLSGGAVLFGAATDAGPWRAAGLIGNLVGLNATATPPLLLVRPDDGLLLTLSLVNLDVRTGGGRPPQLALHDLGSDGHVILGLGPQSLFEQATFDPGSGPVTPPRPVPARLSGPSRIVLRVPAGTAPFGYDLQTLLDLARFPLSVSPFAKNRGPGAPEPTAPPGPADTAIEAPVRASLMLVSPMGTSLDLEGHWESGLIGWRHRSWLSRDNYSATSSN
jgi:hypothetical protein